MAGKPVAGHPGYRFQANEDGSDPPRLIAPNGKVVAVFGRFWREVDVRKAVLEHVERVNGPES